MMKQARLIVNCIAVILPIVLFEYGGVAIYAAFIIDIIFILLSNRLLGMKEGEPVRSVLFSPKQIVIIVAAIFCLLLYVILLKRLDM